MEEAMTALESLRSSAALEAETGRIRDAEPK
jgi:hypothetical protein